MGRFDSAIALAARLIQKNGRLVQLVRVENGPPPDPDMPWRPGDATAQAWPVYVVFLSFPATRVDGTQILRTDLQGYLAADGLPIEPQVDDIIMDGDHFWAIQNAPVLMPNEQRIMYELQLREKTQLPNTVILRDILRRTAQR